MFGLNKITWAYIFNIDTIAVFIIVIAVLYCLFTTKLEPRIFKFSDVNVITPEGKVPWSYGLPHTKLHTKPKKKAKLNKHEERCRGIFQEIYNERFKSVRPSWLKNPVTGKNLELDGFCPSIRTPIGIGLAFEYDGVQHSKYNKHFHRHGPDEFLYQCKKDSWKDIKCKKEGVFLVRIPHFVSYEDLEKYITNKLSKNKLLPLGNNHKLYYENSNIENKRHEKTLKNIYS
jgi:hypothetical protein